VSPGGPNASAGTAPPTRPVQVFRSDERAGASESKARPDRRTLFDCSKGRRGDLTGRPLLRREA